MINDSEFKIHTITNEFEQKAFCNSLGSNPDKTMLNAAIRDIRNSGYSKTFITSSFLFIQCIIEKYKDKNIQPFTQSLIYVFYDKIYSVEMYRESGILSDFYLKYPYSIDMLLTVFEQKCKEGNAKSNFTVINNISQNQSQLDLATKIYDSL